MQKMATFEQKNRRHPLLSSSTYKREIPLCDFEISGCLIELHEKLFNRVQRIDSEKEASQKFTVSFDIDLPPKKSRKSSLFQVKLIKTAGDKFHKNLNNPKVLNLLLQYVFVEKRKEEKKPAQIIRQEWKLLQFFLLQIAAECCQSFLALNSQGFVVNVGTSQQRRLRLLERVPSQTHT